MCTINTGFSWNAFFVRSIDTRPSRLPLDNSYNAPRCQLLGQPSGVYEQTPPWNQPSPFFPRRSILLRLPRVMVSQALLSLSKSKQKPLLPEDIRTRYIINAALHMSLRRDTDMVWVAVVPPCPHPPSPADPEVAHRGLSGIY